jgi:hypothetical protein
VSSPRHLHGYEFASVPCDDIRGPFRVEHDWGWAGEAPPNEKRWPRPVRFALIALLSLLGWAAIFGGLLAVWWLVMRVGR